jgi:hypothetical protein
VFKGLVRKAKRNELLEMLRATEPRATYCDCLNFTIRSGSQKATKYAAVLFKKIYGTWPRPCDLGPPAPLPNLLLDEWVALRKRKATTMIRGSSFRPRSRSNQRCAAGLYTEDAKSRDPSP